MSEKYYFIIAILGIIILAMLINVFVKKSKERRISSNITRSNTTVARTNSTATAVRQQGQSSSGITEFGPVTYYANDRHNRTDKWFKFYYKKVNGEWLTYIKRMPSLNGRDGNLHLTHRYCNSSGEYWICYDPQPRTLKDAQTISRAWADRELEYIATGTPFENQRL